ncbi:MAG TPA: hypothetical protein VJB63_04055 [Patescibacteria group bacterium]|nr:hypothetical protein [Patescibacteria group bacterium]
MKERQPYQSQLKLGKLPENVKYGISCVLVGASMLLIYKGLEMYKEHEFNIIKKEFPSYIDDLEEKSVDLEYKPKLQFEKLSIGLGGCASNDSVILNNSNFDILINPNKRVVVKHELAHLYVQKMIEKNNPFWIKYDGEYVSYHENKSMQFKIINEGCAEYLRVKKTYDKPNPEYIGYYLFVKPILDQYGVQEGIKYLVIDPPRENELKRNQIVSYYQRLGLNLSESVEKESWEKALSTRLSK